MLYMRFLPVALNRWDVFTPAKSTKPIATVSLQDGECSVTATGRALSRGELASVYIFMDNALSDMLTQLRVEENELRREMRIKLITQDPKWAERWPELAQEG